MLTDNIFRLVNRFGAEEDQVSANFAFMLGLDAPALGDFLRKCGLPPETKDVEVRVQVPYEGGSSRIDIEIRKRGAFLLFLESKIWGNPLHKGQLLKYAKILRARKEEYGIAVRLLVATQMDQSVRFYRFAKGFPLDESEYLYLRWKDVQDMIAGSSTKGWKKGVKRMFLDYAGDMMRDKRVVSNMRVGDLAEVLVWSTTPDFWEVNRRRHFCTAKMLFEDGRKAPETADAMFIAFYRVAPISAITHIAQVKSIESYVPTEEVYKGTAMERKAEEWGTIVKVYRLGRFVELPRPIPKGKAVPIISYRKTTLTKLLSARTIADL